MRQRLDRWSPCDTMVVMKSLYGENISDIPLNTSNMSVYQEMKLKNKYHKAGDDEVSRKCRFCDNLISCCYHGKVYYKCRLIGVSRCDATDIRVGHTCNEFIEYKEA